MSVWEIKKKKNKAKVTVLVQCKITCVAAHKEYSLGIMISVFRSKIE